MKSNLTGTFSEEEESSEIFPPPETVTVATFGLNCEGITLPSQFAS